MSFNRRGRRDRREGLSLRALRSPRLTVDMLRALGFGLIVLAASPAVAQPRLTFTKDIAPIVWTRCASCHRPGGIGPFSLLTYDDVRGRAAQIAAVTSRRIMPPWKPEAGKGEFQDERRLTDRELESLQQWIAI